MRIFQSARDCARGAGAFAHRTTRALFGVNREMHKLGTRERGTLFVFYVRDVFVFEVAQRRQNRVRGGLPQSAQRRLFHCEGDFFQAFDVFHLAFSRGDFLEDFMDVLRAHSARNALSARFVFGEVYEVFCNLYHAGSEVCTARTAGKRAGSESGIEGDCRCWSDRFPERW